MRRLRQLGLFLALAGLLTVTPLALGAVAAPTESYSVLLHQLAAAKGTPQSVVAATVDKKHHHVRITLANGARPLVSYPAAKDKFLVDTLIKDGVHPIYTKRAAVHHTLRYIAAGVVIVLILIGAGVWFYTRGRENEGEPEAEIESSGGSTA